MKPVVLTIVVFLTGLGMGRFAAPTKVVTKTQVVHDVKLVDHSHIIRTTTIRPDGTKVTAVAIEKDVRGESDNVSQSEKVVERSAPKWLVEGLAGEFAGHSFYGVGVHYRFLGPIFVGASALMAPGGEGFGGALGLGVQF